MVILEDLTLSAIYIRGEGYNLRGADVRGVAYRSSYPGTE